MLLTTLFIENINKLRIAKLMMRSRAGTSGHAMWLN